LKLSDLLAPLLDAKVDHDLIRQQIIAFEKAQSDALEHRRQVDAERQSRKRERDKSRDVTLRHSDRSLTGAGDAPVEVKPLTTDIEPQESKNSTPAAPSPRQHLETVLTTEQAEAVIQHRKSIKAPLTQRSAKLLARELAKCPDPNAAADTMMLRGWRGFEASWLVNPPRAGPAPKLAPMDHFRNYANEISDGQIRDDRGNGGDWDDAPGVPLRAIQHHG
jgi:hypothetical protein